MDIYFFDSNYRYIGHRSLQEGEKIPDNATIVVATVGDKQEAYFANGIWVVSDIVEPAISQEW